MHDDTHTLARTTDPDTSHEAAAEQTAPKRAELQELIVAVLRSADRPVTHDEITAALRLGETVWGRVTPSGVRSRTSELRNAGVVVADAERGVSDAGRPATRWRLATSADEITVRVRPPSGAHDHAAGMAAARRWAAWEYGNAEIAAEVLDAYLRPEEAHAGLDAAEAP